jgi:hypothetical protein
MARFVSLCFLVVLLSLSGCGSSSPSLATLATHAFERTSQVPYRNLHTREMQNDGVYAIEWVEAQTKPGPDQPWHDETTAYTLAHIGTAWRIVYRTSPRPSTIMQLAWERSHLILAAGRPLWQHGQGTSFPLTIRNPGTHWHTVTWRVTLLTSAVGWSGNPPVVQSASVVTTVPRQSTKHVVAFLSPRKLPLHPGRLYYAIDARRAYASGAGILCDLPFQEHTTTWQGTSCPHRVSS